MEENGWKEYQKLVMKELTDNSTMIELLRRDITALRVEIAMLKTRAAIWGGIAGMVLAIIFRKIQF